MKVSIIVCTHKLTFIPNSKLLQPVFVGKNRNNVILPESYLCDDCGDNISDLNNSYCELTGLYWAWKNLKCDYIGLCHYRRYFSFRPQNMMKLVANSFVHYFGHIYYAVKAQPKVGMYYPYQYNVTSEIELSKIVNEFEIDLMRWFKKYPSCELFALKPVNKGFLSNFFQFASVAGSHHLEIVRKIVEKLYPSISPFYNETLLSNKLYYANMVIMKEELFKFFCDFLFSILEEYNRILIQEGYYINKNEKSISRITGYMGELLTSSFISYYISKNHTKGRYKFLFQVQYDPQ